MPFQEVRNHLTLQIYCTHFRDTVFSIPPQRRRPLFTITKAREAFSGERGNALQR